ncbi:hypothetical protein TNCV_2226961 [Trichonephila clavipes]|uniref:Uncharacterized protein n=1 Tax=Trichonephila clavipes TaxID=2585209 RepID=A0A8X6WFV2_TRICX|nr:hypothetical protein TNCV_2226961 [Trichonephila clavipes]
MDELIKMHEKDIEELEHLDPVQSETRIMVGNSTEDLSLIEKWLQILENIDSNEDHFPPTKQRMKNIISICYEEILWEKK